MEKLLEGEMQLDRELAPERAFAPAIGSLLLHGGILASIALYIADEREPGHQSSAFAHT
jgi:hypothetical protein